MDTIARETRQEIKGLPHQMSNLFSPPFKGEVSRKFGVISKPKNVCLTTETKN